MNTQQRDQLKRASLDFINSEQFFGYLEVLYEPVCSQEHMLLNIQDAYRESMADAVVEMSVLWMAHPSLLNGESSSAPSLLVAGASGTEESERYVEYVCQRTAKKQWEAVPPNVVDETLALFADDRFGLFRSRTLPLTLTEGYPVYLFDTILSRDCMIEEQGQPHPHVPCLINPEGKVKAFTIPLFVMAAASRF